MELMKNFINDESGQGLVEYALIIALVAIVCVIALTNLQGGIDGVFESITDELTPAPAAEG